MQFKSLFYALACAALVSTQAFAQAAQPYYSPKIIAPEIIGPPPAKDSPLWEQEILQIIEIQKHVSADNIEDAKAERVMTTDLMIKEAYPGLMRTQYPHVYKLLDRIASTSEAVTGRVKKHWDTKRPYLLDTRVKALLDPHDNPAYPSGHTSRCYSWAYVLSMLFPDKHDYFFARAEKIAQHRVMVGMHYPHDLEGGRELAAIMIGGMLHSAEFRHDLAAAKEELAKNPPAEVENNGRHH